jgi:hypothetical protein
LSSNQGCPVGSILFEMVKQIPTVWRRQSLRTQTDEMNTPSLYTRFRLPRGKEYFGTFGGLRTGTASSPRSWVAI